MPHTPTHLLRETGAEFKLGDAGFDVETLQIQLANAGFNPGNPDGIYGQDTAKAHQQFRSALAKEALTAESDTTGAPPTESFIEQLAGAKDPTLSGGLSTISPPAPIEDGRGFRDRLSSTLADPDVQKVLLAIGGALSSSDPSKAPGFGARLEQAVTPIIDSGIEQDRKEKEFALEEKKVEAGISQGEERLSQQSISLGLRADATQAQVDLTNTKIKQIQDSGTFEERAALERELVELKAGFAQARKPSQVLTDDIKMLGSINQEVRLDPSTGAGLKQLADGSTIFVFEFPAEASRLYREKVSAAKLAGRLSQDFPQAAFTQNDISVIPTGTVFTIESFIEFKDADGKVVKQLKAGEIWKKVAGKLIKLKNTDLEFKDGKRVSQ